MPSKRVGAGVQRGTVKVAMGLDSSLSASAVSQC